MREIKFRGRKINTNKWVVGNLGYTKTSGGNSGILVDGKLHIVDSETVSQYTGLKDSKGNEIYDGDIVQISGHPFQGSIDIDGNYVVGYNEYMELSCGGWYLHRMRHWAEVIGNKFENKELLKGADEE
ncbi:YopX family protein [Bacillus cereus]|uniref:YopX family protein n=1 Tax=Bacillus cereus TaxID=1396 RepID=UPI00211D7BD1|nr:YopX family protein [Bacillus cereus]